MQSFQVLINNLLVPVRNYVQNNLTIANCNGSGPDASDLDSLTKSMLWMRSWLWDNSLTAQKVALAQDLLQKIDALNVDEKCVAEVLRLNKALNTKLHAMHAVIEDICVREQQLLKDHNEKKPASFDAPVAVLKSMVDWLQRGEVLMLLSITTAYEVAVREAKPLTDAERLVAPKSRFSAKPICMPMAQRVTTYLFNILLDLQLDRFRSEHMIAGYARQVPDPLAKASSKSISKCIFDLNEFNEINYTKDMRLTQLGNCIDALVQRLTRDQNLTRGILPVFQSDNALISSVITELNAMSDKVREKMELKSDDTSAATLKA